MSQAATPEKGFFGSLFDLSFKHYVIPKLLKAIYVVIIILAALGTLVWIAFAFKIRPALGIIVLMVGGPLYFIFTVILWRVFIEIVMSWFNAVKSLDTLANATVAISNWQMANGHDVPGGSPFGDALGTPGSGSPGGSGSLLTEVSRRCTNCHAEFEPGAKFCQDCGAPAP